MTDLVVLDVNETLFSLDAVERRMDEVGLTGQLQAWFAAVLRDGFAAAAAGRFAAFPDLARSHLHRLAQERGLALDEERIDAVIDAFEEVEAHDDVEPGLRELQDAGVTVVTMTNGTVEITRSFLARCGLEDLVDATYDVSSVQRWKPAPEPYRYVLDQHGVDAAAAALVAVHPWDVQGAIAAGLAGVWVDRAGTPWPAGFAPATHRAPSFDAAVRTLLD